MKKNQNRKIAAGIMLFIAALLLLSAVYLIKRPTPEPAKSEGGEKRVKITVVSKDGKETEYSIRTDAKYLRGAMDDAGKEGLAYSGREGTYGLMVDTVNEEKASFEENGAYWAFLRNGEYCSYGIDEQTVADGDSFEIRYTIGE